LAALGPRFFEGNEKTRQTCDGMGKKRPEAETEFGGDVRGRPMKKPGGSQRIDPGNSDPTRQSPNDMGAAKPHPDARNAVNWRCDARYSSWRLVPVMR